MARVGFRELRRRLDNLKDECGEQPPIVTYTFRDGHEEKRRDSTIFILEHMGEIASVTPPTIDGFFEALGTATITELWE